jgi:exosortase/archaeosortase family protein
LLGAVTYRTALLFVPGLKYVAGPNPVISGPSLDVQIIFACSGIDGVYLFDYLFGLALLLEWSRLNKFRALVSYAAGVASILAANVVRLVLLVVVGNLISAQWVSRVHVNAGWLFFSAVFLCYMTLAYPFMLGRRDQSSAPSLPPGSLMQESA